MSIGFTNTGVTRNLSKSNISEMMGMEINLELTGKQIWYRHTLEILGVLFQTSTIKRTLH